MIDAGTLGPLLRAHGLERWSDVVAGQLKRVLVDKPHGDWPRWRAALDALPPLPAGRVVVDQGGVALRTDAALDADTVTRLRDALKMLSPWRKGPYRIGELLIDTEWRSDMKWDRLADAIAPLDGRLVLDVGCGNGYHCWRMAMAGARQVIGIDPSPLFFAQFHAVRRMLQGADPDLATRVALLPVGIEEVPGELRAFDTVFSMGVLYHRRSPIDHLLELRGMLRARGQLVLETLVIDAPSAQVLIPESRYAKMRNVWFIPTIAMLEIWLRRAGFQAPRTVDVSPTTTKEQRSTDWMPFESLADFLDPADSRLTVEGYPAPRRAIMVAEA